MKNQMQDTQLEAYTAKAEEFTSKEEKMLKFFQDHPSLRFTDLQLAYNFGWKLSCVNGRRNKLYNDGKIEKAGKIKNIQTGVSNITWRLKK